MWLLWWRRRLGQCENKLKVLFFKCNFYALDSNKIFFSLIFVVKRKVRYLLIKGASCFVYISENGLSPKYAISLAKINAKYEQKVHQGTTTVYLQTSLGDIEYTMIFDTRESDEIAATFLDVVNEQARVAQAELISKRLGHGHLGERKASVIFADTLAKEKVKNQPDKPVTAAEILDATPGARNGGLTL
mmetsp:Transcript_66279/g.98227  ORF Transcript_66279/g.98227 Transcript_66279/m.98227 type:complete len:189 (-) Transcript_66279:574-1140(-)